MVPDKIVNAVVRIAIVFLAVAIIVEGSLFVLGGSRAVQNGIVNYIMMLHQEPKPAPAPAPIDAPASRY